MSCRGKLSGQYLIFELKIPLMNSAKYQIFKPIPFPTIEGIFIQSSMDYLITSIHRDEYYMMSRDEFSHCRNSNYEYICMLLHPIHSTNTKHSICELNLLASQQPFNCHIVKAAEQFPQDSWFRLKNNKWIFSVRQERRATIVCDEKFEAVQLPRNGIISLANGCTLKEGSILLKTHKIFKETTIDSSYLPKVNLSMQWMGRPINNSIQMENSTLVDDMTELHKRIQQLQEEQLPVSHHNIHHYSLLYAIIAFSIIALIVYKYKKRKRPPPNEAYSLERSAPENVDST